VKPGGWVLIEFSPEQADAVLALFSVAGSAYDQATLVNDLSQQPRMLRAHRRTGA
jgi:methylase of polypeptide subunit release factors